MVATCVMAFVTIFALQLGIARADNLLSNPGFEEPGSTSDSAEGWQADGQKIVPLTTSPEAYSGERSALITGSEEIQMWRQDAVQPTGDRWQLTAQIRAKDATFGPGDYVHLYGHIIYRDQPYSTATHFYAAARPGTYDWRPMITEGLANAEFEVDRIHVSLIGKMKQGTVWIDEVSLSPVSAEVSRKEELTAKAGDLKQQLERIGEVDDTVRTAQSHLAAVEEALKNSPPRVDDATRSWEAAARALSHQAWAKMYPEAMSDAPVEAQMLYHGMGIDKEATARNLDKLELAGVNGVYLSFGSWMYVSYHSDILPVEPAWQEFDALTYFIDEAHKRGLKVFGYYAPFYGTYSVTSYPGSIAAEHPEWLAKGPDPAMPTFPDPANPQVVDYIASVYRELATRYNLDGIGLDYIRYPTEISLNYDENNRRQILDRYGIDIFTHENVAGDPVAWSKIQEFRRENIGKVIERVSRELRDARPDLTIMACLISEREWARDEFGQDWANSSKYIDYASPMNYDDRSLDLKMLRDQKETFQRTGAVWIPALGGMPPVHRSWTISDWAERVAIQRRLEPGGIIIYRLGDFDPAVAAFFGKGPFFSDAAFPSPPRR